MFCSVWLFFPDCHHGTVSRHPSIPPSITSSHRTQSCHSCSSMQSTSSQHTGMQSQTGRKDPRKCPSAHVDRNCYLLYLSLFFAFLCLSIIFTFPFSPSSCLSFQPYFLSHFPHFLHPEDTLALPSSPFQPANPLPKQWGYGFLPDWGAPGAADVTKAAGRQRQCVMSLHGFVFDPL